MRNSKETVLQAAQHLALRLKQDVTGNRVPDVALVLGTGWGEALRLEHEHHARLDHFSAFNGLAALEGHRRIVACGDVGSKRVIVLRGRVHLNEHPADPDLAMLVRLQVQMMLELGVRRFILTNAAGALRDDVRVGDIVIADGFVTLWAPVMPLYGGEFCSPEDALPGASARGDARHLCPSALTARLGGYAMVRGPFFEGRRYDKTLLKATGAACVGMSTVPEACVISLYRGAKALCLSFITNDDKEEHSHETNVSRAAEKSAYLGEYLERLIAALP